jgi:2-polyprenyl-6-methoxyphenol hydroxylase-like FAD-dependent oxidoreductase
MTETTTCAIVGGGPAGMVLGLLLARAGLDVTVLEKHADFLRDFRGDTVHPTTMRLLDDLGLFEKFARLPQSKLEQARIDVDGQHVTMVDFRRLRMPYPYVAMVPQWDLLNLLADAALAEPTFSLRMRHEVTGLLRDGQRVIGVRYTSPDGNGELHADLTVACDGRWSLARSEAGLTAKETPVPFDVWWFRLPREDDASYSLLPRTLPGRMLIMLPREGYYQIAYLIPKGSDARLRARGLEALREELGGLIPEADVATLKSWDDIKFLDVHVNMLKRWHVDGLVCIGDAAHAMSPAGGVGINLAVQDAVGAATILAEPLQRRQVTEKELAAVRRRRMPAAAVIQGVQKLLHRRLFEPVLNGEIGSPPIALVNLIRRFPFLSAIPAYVVGVGIRPERAPAFARRSAVGR